MTQQEHNISVKILDKTYQIKCPVGEVQGLQDAAMYVDQKMREVRDVAKVVGLDRIAVITALNLSYTLLNIEKKESKYLEIMAERIRDMQKRISDALTQDQQAELL